MYVHAHLRYGEAMAVLGEAEALWEALQAREPDRRHRAAQERLAPATQRLFQQQRRRLPRPLRRVGRVGPGAKGTVDVEGGWRIYSSGPGLFVRLLLDIALGLRRQHGEPAARPALPARLGPVTLAMTLEGGRREWEVSGT